MRWRLWLMRRSPDRLVPLGLGPLGLSPLIVISLAPFGLASFSAEAGCSPPFPSLFPFNASSSLR